MSKLIVYFDGACRNDGSQKTPMGIGVVAFFSQQEEMEIIEEFACYESSLGTSYRSEVFALYLAINVAVTIYDLFEDEIWSVVIRGDNESVIKQFNGEYMVMDSEMRRLFENMFTIVKQSKLQKLKVEWIPRTQNTVADKLSKIGLKDGVEAFQFEYGKK